MHSANAVLRSCFFMVSPSTVCVSDLFCQSHALHTNATRRSESFHPLAEYERCPSSCATDRSVGPFEPWQIADRSADGDDLDRANFADDFKVHDLPNHLPHHLPVHI